MKNNFLTIIFVFISTLSFGQDTTHESLKGAWVDPETLFEQPKDTIPAFVAQSLEADKKFLETLPQTYEKLTPSDMKSLATNLESKLTQLIKEKEELIKNKASQSVIDEKDGSIKSLSKEKTIVDLSIKSDELTTENEEYEKWLVWAGIALFCLLIILVLATVSYLQRRKIVKQSKKILEQATDIEIKSGYLEYAARLIRHDMHSGINTYIPRGISSLEKRVTPEEIQNLKIDGSLKMIKEGLNHTQKVYKNVYEFTNLVKKETVLERSEYKLNDILTKHLSGVAYKDQVELDELPILNVNELLFSTAIDNLIRNGLKYNDSEAKKVKIFVENDFLIVEDNGRGMSQKDFQILSKPYIRGENQKETGDGLGLTISLAILNEHGFKVSCDKIDTGGTKLKISLS